MPALDKRPQRVPSYGDGDALDMTDYQRATVAERSAARLSREAFQAADLARRAEAAAQREIGTTNRFDRTMDYRDRTQRGVESRFDRTMDYRRSTQAGVQSRFEQAQALREEAEARRQENDERTALQSARRLKLDVDKDARAIEFEEKKFNNVEGFDKEVTAIEEAFGNDPVKAAALTVAAARKFPLVSEDKRTFAQVEHATKLLEKWQVNPKLPMALWEASQFDPREMKAADARQYLGTIAAKYPEVANDSTLSGMLKSKMEQIDLLESRATEVPEGLEPSSATAGPDGKVSITYSDPKKSASLEREEKAELASMEKERKLTVDQFAKARNARTRAGVILESALKTKKQDAINAANDLIKAADDDINEWRAKRDDIESRMKSKTAPSAPVLESKDQFDALPSGAEYIRNGVRYRKP